MSQVFKCDRCGKTDGQSATTLKDSTRTLKENGASIELCNACAVDFDEWLSWIILWVALRGNRFIVREQD